MNTQTVPLEEVEQRLFVEWLRIKDLAHFHVPNSTYTKSWKQKNRNHDLGVVPGVPDLFIIVKDHLIAIEMKRAKGGTVSPDQKEWLARLNAAGVPAWVARGAEEAIAIVQEVEASA